MYLNIIVSTITTESGKLFHILVMRLLKNIFLNHNDILIKGYLT